MEKIKSPKGLKKLSAAQLNALAGDIREFLIKSVSETGGHLASNLGVVELTIALHYCFDSPKDKIVWDVGHQSYVHKILTGRVGKFSSLRKLGGLSGFPKASESKHDIIDTGHSSTSISAALGLAVARDLKNEDHSVIAVIGDGSMTGGLAFEGLNHAGRLDTNLIVVLNDNQMSISENVGAMSRYLNDLRIAPTYIGAKRDVKRILGKLPVIGNGAIRAIEKTKDSLKHTLTGSTVFDDYGFNYIGPVDGHDIKELIKVLRRIKKLSGPILLHVYTVKGKGYLAAEEQPVKYHGIGPYEPERESSLEPDAATPTYSSVFGGALRDLARTDGRILAVTAAMPHGTGIDVFAEEYPERFFDVGIAEAHAVTFAAGLAKSGFKPVVAVYSTFLQRAYDQILHDVCLPKLPVIFAVDRAGVVDGDGETHQGLYDIAFLSHIPNITVMSPKNASELVAMLRFAIDRSEPVCIRYPRGAAPFCANEIVAPIEAGRAEIITEGKDTAIIALGEMVEVACAAAERLKKDGISPTVVNARFVKPIDEQLFESLKEYKHVFTIESATRIGGLGQAAAAEFARIGSRASFFAFSFPDEFIPQGTRGELMSKYGFDADEISEKIKERI